jgi:hypothetical protein
MNDISTFKAIPPKSITKGQVSHMLLALFFSKGYAAQDIVNCPGGFTMFMFRPKTAQYSRNPEEEQNAIRSMFGETNLDEESIKYFSKKDFYAGTFDELKEQLKTTIEFLNLSTSAR